MKEMLKINKLEENGRLYENEQLGTVESLIQNPYATCHAADLIELPNGDILCCWFAGSDEGNADVSIVMSRLPHGEVQWSKAYQVSDDPTRSEQNPSFFLAPNGELWIIYTAQISREEVQKPEGFNLQYTAEIRAKKSNDGGYTWGETVTLFSRSGSFCRQTIQVLSNGRWVFGNWICFSDDTRNGSDITVVQISDDEGKTWREVEIPGSYGRVHANLLETGKGKLIALFRSRFADRIYIAFSDDNGDTWTEPQLTELPNNNSSISAIKLKSGRIGIIYNPSSYNTSQGKTVWPQQRSPVAIALSEDGGLTWPYKRLIEHGEGFFGQWNDINNHRYEYPIMMQSADEKIHVAYSWGTRRCVKYAQVTEEWILGSKRCFGAENDPLLPGCRW